MLAGVRWNLTFQLFAPLAAAAGDSHDTIHYACMDYWYARLVMIYACVGCVCVVYVHQRYTQQSHSMFVWTASVRVLCYVNM